MTCSITTEYLSALVGSIGFGVCVSFGLYLGYRFARAILKKAREK
jgi:hypothetical protein